MAQKNEMTALLFASLLRQQSKKISDLEEWMKRQMTDLTFKQEQIHLQIQQLNQILLKSSSAQVVQTSESAAAISVKTEIINPEVTSVPENISKAVTKPTAVNSIKEVTSVSNTIPETIKSMPAVPIEKKEKPEQKVKRKYKPRSKAADKEKKKKSPKKTTTKRQKKKKESEQQQSEQKQSEQEAPPIREPEIKEHEKIKTIEELMDDDLDEIFQFTRDK